MKSNDELIAEQLHTDPESRGEWERTTLARAVAIAIVLTAPTTICRSATSRRALQ
jgi:hypothetical protein